VKKFLYKSVCVCRVRVSVTHTQYIVFWGQNFVFVFLAVYVKIILEKYMYNSAYKYRKCILKVK